MKAPFKVLWSNDTTNIINKQCNSSFRGDPNVFNADKIHASIDEVADIGVDVHMLQPGFSWIPWYNSAFYTRADHEAWFKRRFPDKTPDPITRYWLAGGDIVGDFVARCREKGQSCFVSMRMNHNPFPGLEEITSSRFYDEHPEYRIGDPKCLLDWTIEDVREHRFTQIREICENYDIDGFELDFMRYSLYFDATRTTSEQRREIMKDFVSRVRQLLDRTARPGQHRWLCVRVPSELASHDVLGIDLCAMAHAGVEMVNLSCYYFTQQQNDLARICAMLPETAVYLEVTYCSSRNTKEESAERDERLPSDLQLYSAAVRRLINEHHIHTAAYLAYRRGAAGLSLFNFVYYRFYRHEPPLHVIKRLRAPEWLAKQPQWYFVDEHDCWYWQSDYRGMLPQEFTPDQRHDFALDLAPTPALKEGILRLMTREDSSRCSWKVAFNGRPLEFTAFVRKPLDEPYTFAQGKPEQYACFTCPVAVVKDGVNIMEVILKAGPRVTLRYFDLVLK